MAGSKKSILHILLTLLSTTALAQAADIDNDGVPDENDACCNTPPGIAVDATGRPIGDLDADCDVDLQDFALFVANLTGPLAPVACPSCTDSMLNGDETDVDCGGGTCSACADGLMCVLGSDCVSMICQAGFCQSPSCTDFVQNDQETDVDCGGGDCPACADGLMCVAGSDCQSFVCQFNVCATPTCNDGVQNGTETGVDCGGSCSPCPQPNGAPCGGANECLSNFCVDGHCCNAPCTGTCEACDVFGFIGVCTFVPADTDPDNECAGPQACDGSGNCKLVEGSPCGSPLSCISGFCVDGRCCDTSCNGTCESCNLPGSEGMCDFIPDGEDPDDECSFPFSCDGNGGCG